MEANILSDEQVFSLIIKELVANGKYINLSIWVGVLVVILTAIVLFAGVCAIEYIYSWNDKKSLKFYALANIVQIILVVGVFTGVECININRGLSTTVLKNCITVNTTTLKVPLSIPYTIDAKGAKELISKGSITLTLAQEDGSEEIIQMSLGENSTTCYSDLEEYIVTRKYTYRINSEYVKERISKELIDTIENSAYYGMAVEFHYNPNKESNNTTPGIDVGSSIKVNVNVSTDVSVE